jgi:hypothetical protein
MPAQKERINGSARTRPARRGLYSCGETVLATEASSRAAWPAQPAGGGDQFKSGPLPALWDIHTCPIQGGRRRTTEQP